MAKKINDKDTKTTKTKKVNVDNPVSEQKEDKIVNPEKDLDEKEDVSEVVTPENTSENPEKPDTEQESLNTTEEPVQLLNETSVTDNDVEEQTPINKVVTPEQQIDDTDEAETQSPLNEVVTPDPIEEKANEAFSGQVDGPVVEGDLSDVIDPKYFKIDPSQFLNVNRDVKPALYYDAAAPTAFYVEDGETPSYNAQCPPKPKSERKGAYVAQRPY